MNKISYFVFLVLFFAAAKSFAGSTDYFDRLLIYQGVEKGLIYKGGKTDSSLLYLKTGFGYGADDDKILNLNFSVDKDLNRCFVNPEFMLLVNEFSRLKFFLSAGLDFGIINKFETSFRTSEGLIFDIFSFFSLLLGIDTRINIYDDFYIESFGLVSAIIRI
ncbi:MAG: hypothetical protein N3B13_04855 [Deltaproteobacteria bacterium]|nr:hypothetical protein [Deltaproteobacteria bacterium]